MEFYTFATAGDYNLGKPTRYPEGTVYVPGATGVTVGYKNPGTGNFESFEDGAVTTKDVRVRHGTGVQLMVRTVGTDIVVGYGV